MIATPTRDPRVSAMRLTTSDLGVRAMNKPMACQSIDGWIARREDP